MLPRSMQKTLRLYRNRLAAFWWSADAPARNPGGGDDYYRSRYQRHRNRDRDRERGRGRDRDYYNYYDRSRSRSRSVSQSPSRSRSRSRDRERRKRRLRKRLLARIATPIAILSVMLLVCTGFFGVQSLLEPKPYRRVRPFFPRRFKSLPSPKLNLDNLPQHAGSSSTDGRKSGGDHDRGKDEAHGPNAQEARKEHPQGGRDKKKWDSNANENASRFGMKKETLHHQAQGPVSAAGIKTSSGNDASTEANDSMTRTCYTNVHSYAGLCVHVPMCIERTSYATFADVLRCAPFTNGQGRESTMSGDACVDLEHRHETHSLFHPVHRRPASWMSSSASSIEWLTTTSDAILMRLPARAVSVPFFTSRILMLHHVLRHAQQRYGLPNVKVILIAAHPSVSKKLRYSKSWQHGLLNAAVYPSVPVYSRAAAHRLVGSIEERQKNKFDNRNGGDADAVVFVTDGEWDVVPPHGKISAACIRRVAIVAPPATSEPKLFLRAAEFPGVSVPMSLSDSSLNHIGVEEDYADAQAFRHNVFSSLSLLSLLPDAGDSNSALPRLSNRIVYLHRANTRTFSPKSLRTFQSILTSVSSPMMRYQLVDVSGMTFPQQVKAVGGAAIVVGVHGTQMMNTLFLERGAAIIEVFPYRFSNDLIKHAAAGPHLYQAYAVETGSDFKELRSYRGDVHACRHSSVECRKWYQSDDRPIEFNDADAQAFTLILQKALLHVAPAIHRQ